MLAVGVKADKLEAQLKTVKPGAFVWTPKINDQIQLDEIYKVFPRFSTVQKTIPLNDPRFPTLRHVLQTSRQDLDGIIKFTDFLVYDYPGPIRRIKSTIDPILQIRYC